MLSRKNRLTASFFKKVRQQKMLPVSEFSTRVFRVRFYASSHPYGRFAVVVPNAEFKSIVARNRFRRMVYEVIRTMSAHMQITSDVALFLKKGQGTASKEMIADAMHSVRTHL